MALCIEFAGYDAANLAAIFRGLKMTGEELRRRRGGGTGAGEWSRSVCSLYHPFGQTAREGREENWLLSLDWEEVQRMLTRSALAPAPTRLTDSDMLPRNGRGGRRGRHDKQQCTSYQPRSRFSAAEAEIKRGDRRRGRTT